MPKNRILPELSEDLQDRFWEKVDTDGDDCWIWKAATRPDGVGVFGIGKLSYYAHRIAYVLSRGPIPEDLEVRKTCRNAACCRPIHLYLSPKDQPRDDAQKTIRYLI